MSTEHPILFSDEMVRTILAGQKTETRRVYRGMDKATADALDHTRSRAERYRNVDWNFGPDGWGGVSFDYLRGRCTNTIPMQKRSPYGGPGALLWVRECWATGKTCDNMSPRAIGAAAVEAGWEGPWAPIVYRADGNFNRAVWPVEFRKDWGGKGKDRPSTHMPKWAARIWLRVVEVRVERLQQITPAGIRDEGVQLEHDMGSMDSCGICEGEKTLLLQQWVALWDGINAGRGFAWASDPWVWVVRFEVVSTTGRAGVPDAR